ncbi:hypothetical protein C8F01DRAFT_1167386 [Mycena amicta]|nr:hypothetical protein C8F01DRAFT_1177086 [Mycena amicta]KAJ7053422.1 hypothetical protein C8F01DRAFT_1167386 [Mycena amicta]
MLLELCLTLAPAFSVGSNCPRISMSAKSSGTSRLSFWSRSLSPLTAISSQRRPHDGSARSISYTGKARMTDESPRLSSSFRLWRAAGRWYPLVI